MKLIKKTLLAAACASTLLFAGGASAAGTQTLTPTATVPATCVFTSGPYSMPFGTLVPGSPGSFTTTIAYQCTNGTAASSIKVNSASSPTTVTIANTTDATTLPVGLTWVVPVTPGTGIGAFPSITMNILGSITAANTSTATAGAYTAVYNIDLLP